MMSEKYNSARCEAAKEQYAKYSGSYIDEINNCVANSKVYRGPLNMPPEIIVISLYVNSAILFYNGIYDNIGVLNFASFTRPGGGFIKGSIAQEEALCTGSVLYNVLEQFQHEYDINKNPEHYNNGLYENFAIYSPKVYFPNINARANILTCAAPNLASSSLDLANPADSDNYINTFKSRIKYILDIFEANHNTTLILGAFGCGVFKNDPHIVASLFKEVLNENNYSFNKIIFAIPDKDSENYKAFKIVFSNN